MAAGDSLQVADGADRVWLYILQHTDDKYVKGLQAVLDRYASHISVLANVQAPNGYPALELAPVEYRKVIKTSMMFLKRYEFTRGEHEHKSATCEVWLARDHRTRTRWKWR